MNVWAYNVRGSLEWGATTDAQQAAKMMASPRFEVRVAAQPEAAQPEHAPQDTEADDALLLDWIARQGDEFSLGILQDMPGDGDYFVHGMDGAGGQGKTFRDAIRDAMPSYAPWLAAQPSPREQEHAPDFDAWYADRLRPTDRFECLEAFRAGEWRGRCYLRTAAQPEHAPRELFLDALRRVAEAVPSHPITPSFSIDAIMGIYDQIHLPPSR